MSNPAVIKLASGKVGRSQVWMDDNFGESIHLHIDDMRVDMTVSEIADLHEDLCAIMNDQVDIENLDYRTIDPVLLSGLLAPYHNKVYRLEDSVGVRVLRGEIKAEEHRKSGHISQSEQERMSGLLESIKEHGYPHNRNYIVLYGDDNIIRDGQHRASCLFYLNGDMEVPVLRLFFDGYRSPKIHKYYNSSLFSFCRMQRACCASGFHKFKKILKQILKVFK